MGSPFHIHAQETLEIRQLVYFDWAVVSWLIEMTSTLGITKGFHLAMALSQALASGAYINYRSDTSLEGASHQRLGSLVARRSFKRCGCRRQRQRVENPYIFQLTCHSSLAWDNCFLWGQQVGFKISVQPNP